MIPVFAARTVSPALEAKIGALMVARSPMKGHVALPAGSRPGTPPGALTSEERRTQVLRRIADAGGALRRCLPLAAEMGVSPEALVRTSQSLEQRKLIVVTRSDQGRHFTMRLTPEGWRRAER